MKIKQIINPDNNMWRSADPPQRVIQLERRRHVFIKCKKEKLQRNAVVNEMIKNQR